MYQEYHQDWEPRSVIKDIPSEDIYVWTTAKDIQMVHIIPKIYFKKILIALIQFISVNQYLRHNSDYKKIQVVRRNEVYFSSSNVSTDTTVIVKD